MSKHSKTSLFQMEDFRPYLRDWAQAKGRGEFRRMSIALKMHTTLLSQVMGGRKCLTEEQASRLCAYMALSLLETDYFIKLVQMERAGDPSLRNVFKRHLSQLQDQAKDASSRVPVSRTLSEQDRAIFYSSWQYSLIRLLTSIDRYQTIDGISRRLDLPLSRVKAVLDFLVSRRLCEQGQDGRFRRTKINTHVEARSQLAIRHHQNWRARSLTLQERMTQDDLSFTAPVSLSAADVPKVREILLDAVSRISKLIDASEPEEVVYLGIDWIKM